MFNLHVLILYSNIDRRDDGEELFFYKEWQKRKN